MTESLQSGRLQPIIAGMNAEAGPWTPRAAATNALLDQALEVGEAEARVPGSEHRPPWAAAVRSEAVEQPPPATFYCDTCWAPLAETATECSDCCRSRADMLAESDRRAAADGSWKPERSERARVSSPAVRSQPDRREPVEFHSEVLPAEPTPRVSASVPGVAARPVRQARRPRTPRAGVVTTALRPLVVAAGVGLILGTVALGCFWLSVATFH